MKSVQYKSGSILIEVAVLSFLVISLVVGTLSVQQSQDLLSQAKSNRGQLNSLACKVCSNNICINNKLPCNPDINECETNSDCAIPTTSPVPTQQPTCSGIGGTCIPNGEDCNLTGNGSCSSGKFCCLELASTPTPTGFDCSGNTECEANCGSCWPDNYTCTGGQTSSFACNNASEKCYFGGTCTPPATPTPTPKPKPKECGQTCLFNEECGFSGLTCQDKTCWGNSCENVSWDTRDCPIVNGLAYCTQTNPIWANDPFPQCDYPGSNHLYLRACGQANVCSLLCQHVGPQYCNLPECFENDNILKTDTCGGNSSSYLEGVLKQYPDNIVINRVQPDQFVDPNTGKTLTNPEITWKKINEMLEHGPLLVTGKFKPKSSSDWIDHHSMIVKRDAHGRIYNDPYFNSDNPNPLYQVNSNYLEDYLDIKINHAMSVKGK